MKDVPVYSGYKSRVPLTSASCGRFPPSSSCRSTETPRASSICATISASNTDSVKSFDPTTTRGLTASDVDSPPPRHNATPPRITSNAPPARISFLFAPDLRFASTLKLRSTTPRKKSAASARSAADNAPASSRLLSYCRKPRKM